MTMDNMSTRKCPVKVLTDELLELIILKGLLFSARPLCILQS